MTRDLTKPERNVLSHVPESTRVAFARVGDVKRTAELEHDYQTGTVDAVWLRLVASGLIEVTMGFCRRTVIGDMALVEESRPVQTVTATTAVTA